MATPIFDKLRDLHGYGHFDHDCDIEFKSFPFANGHGPGSALNYRFHVPADDAEWLHTVADRNTKRARDGSTLALVNERTAADDDALWDSHQRFLDKRADNNEHADAPGHFTDSDGTLDVHLYGDRFLDARARNRERNGNDAAEDRYRPESD